MKKLPVDVSSLTTMIAGDYVYVDKTQQIYNLIMGGRLYFLSRPRRFGKSLLISTLKEIFEGNKDLFENLWIGKSNYSWSKHPVIHLDFSAISHENAETLKVDLIWTLEKIAKDYNINISDAPSLETKLRSLVEQLSKRAHVVLLVDEYDYPLLKHINSLEAAKKIRDVLSSFFTVIKSLDAYMRAIFITGVTKFSKTSIFSGMNNLNDISLDAPSATLLGYTEEEIANYFKAHISYFSKSKNIKETSIMEEMKRWYNGYSFSGSKDIKVYNPFSILYLLHKQEFQNYWFESSTPTFLIKLIKSNPESIEQLGDANDDIILNRASLGAFDIEDNWPLYPILFQTGYLTIKSYDPTLQSYTLGYPNEEVRLSIATYLMAVATNKPPEFVNSAFFRMKTFIEQNDLKSFFLSYQSLLADIPYDHYIRRESFFHTLLHWTTAGIGLRPQSEVHTSIGRIDLVLATRNRIFLFEFKFDTEGKIALQQIKDRRYYEKYLDQKKPIILVGASFNYDEKRVTIDWMQEIVNEKNSK